MEPFAFEAEKLLPVCATIHDTRTMLIFNNTVLIVISNLKWRKTTPNQKASKQATKRSLSFYSGLDFETLTFFFVGLVSQPKTTQLYCDTRHATPPPRPTISHFRPSYKENIGFETVSNCDSRGDGKSNGCMTRIRA